MKQFNLANILSNPNFIAGVNGISPLGGATLVQAEALKRQQQQGQIEQQEFLTKQNETLRAQKFAETLPSILKDLTVNDPVGNFNKLINAGANEKSALEIMSRFQDVNKQAQDSEFHKEELGIRRGQLGLQQAGLGLQRQELGLKQQELQQKLSGVIDPEERRKIASEYRKEITGSPIHKDFIKTKSTYNNIRELTHKAHPSGFDDNAVIVSLVKLLDPTSTVSSTESVTAENAPGLTQYWLGRIQSWQSQGKLTPQARKEAFNTADSIYKQQAKAYKDYTEPYKRFAIEAGVNPKDVVLFDPQEEQEEPIQATQPKSVKERASALYQQKYGNGE